MRFSFMNLSSLETRSKGILESVLKFVDKHTVVRNI